MGSPFEFAKKFAPNALREQRRLNRARVEDTRMAARFSPPDAELIANAKLLPTRDAMLDLLPKNAVVAEIGVAAGAFSSKIHSVTQPSKLTLIDAWNFEAMPDCGEPGLAKVKAQFEKELTEGTVEILRGFSSDMLKTLGNDTLDWVYVDAGHDYDNVAADLKECLRVVKPGGIIAGDDYLRFDTPLHRYGVIEAVHEMVNTHRAEFLYLTMDYDPNFAVRLPA